MLPQVPKTSDGTASNDSYNVSEGVVLGGRVFGVQWRPQTGNSFPSQNEMVHSSHSCFMLTVVDCYFCGSTFSHDPCSVFFQLFLWV